MDRLNVGGKTYVKSTVIARELGYTSDYIGQLSRAGKLDSKVIGRTRYVHEDGIVDHKTRKYRSTKGVSARHLHVAARKKDVAVPVELHTPSRRSNGKSFYSRARKSVEYEKDEADLIPETKKSEITSKNLNVSLADAKQVKVGSKSSKTKFQSTELPQIKFKGHLQVQDGEIIPQTKKKHVTHLSVDEKPEKHKVKLHRSDNTREKNTKLAQRTFRQRLQKTSKHDKATLHVKKSIPVEPDSTRTHTIVIISSTFVASALVFVVLSLESHITIDGGFATELKFSIKNVLALIFSST